jgi:hypothetical protein
MLENLKKSLEAVKDIAKLLLELLTIVKRHPAFFGTIGLFVCSYVGLRFYAYSFPAQTVREYFREIGNHQFDDSWALIDPDYQGRKWHSDEATYKEEYETSAPPENLHIKSLDASENLFSALFSETLRYEASFEVHERFSRADLQKPGQAANALWVQIWHPKDYPRLMDGTLDQDSLPIRRQFRILVVIRRARDPVGRTSLWAFPSRWAISSMNFTEEGLRPLQGEDD